jgi:hypothetical protein
MQREGRIGNADLSAAGLLTQNSMSEGDPEPVISAWKYSRGDIRIQLKVAQKRMRVTSENPRLALD